MEYEAISSLVFYIFAVMAFICALGVVAFRNPVTSAMCMALSFVATAAILFGMGAQFLGIAQLIVYAGAILVLFLFVVMMLDLKAEERKLTYLPQAVLGVVIASVFAGMVARVSLDLPGARDGKCPFMALICSDCDRQTDAKPSGLFGGPLPALAPAAAAKVLNPGISDSAAASATDIPDTKLIGRKLFTQYNIAFVILAFALLAGAVGSVALGRKLSKD